LPHPSSVSRKIIAYVDFISMNIIRSEGSNRRETSTSIQKWSPPPEGRLLINVDAAIFSKSDRSGYGVVIRNHQGIMMAACRGFVDHVQCSEIAEAIAIRQTLYLAENVRAQYFQVASDCLSVIKKLQQQGLDRSLTGAIVHDIKLRATKFVSCTFKHVYRSCNEAAHVLAKTAEHDQGSCWFNEPPDVIWAIICTEQLFE
jgi:ribonuclease HI